MRSGTWSNDRHYNCYSYYLETREPKERLTPLHQCYRIEWSLPSLLPGYSQANLLSLVLTCRFGARREMDWQRIDYFLTSSAVLFQKAPVKIKMH